MRLVDLAVGERGVVKALKCEKAEERRRLVELGFVTGEEVEVVRNAPLLDPIEVRVRGVSVSIRRKDARFVEVERKG